MTTVTTRPASGRPEPGEYATYAQADIDAVAGGDAVRALADQLPLALALFAPVSEATAASHTYAPGKWTMKQVVGHMIDDERIFAYRMLCVARNDATPLPGFDENHYVRFAAFETRAWADLLAEYAAVRGATLAFLTGLSPEAWRRTGTVNGYTASVRGLAFHVAGHELHHLRVLRERYLPHA